MNGPKIGIVGNLLIDQGGMWPGYVRAYVNNDYVQAVVAAGGVPFILPVMSNSDDIRCQVENMDALIISGGFDVNPLEYGEEPIEKQGFLCPERDNFDLAVIHVATELKKPMLGVCRGIQILNVAFGGTLYQDIPSDESKKHIKHVQSSRPDVAGHTIDVVKGTKLYSIFGESALTNSFHHQAVKDVAKSFNVAARAKDGIVEAIEKKDGFVIGVQFHPEMMFRKNPKMLCLFKTLVKECKGEN